MLLSSLTAYGASTLVRVVMSLMANERFDFDQIRRRIGDHDDGADPELGGAADTPPAVANP